MYDIYNVHITCVSKVYVINEINFDIVILVNVY
jgi:hypothetical protein